MSEELKPWAEALRAMWRAFPGHPPRQEKIAARDDMDRLRAFVRRANEIVSGFGVCSSADDGEDTCADAVCPYCQLVRLVNDSEVDAELEFAEEGRQDDE